MSGAPARDGRPGSGRRPSGNGPNERWKQRRARLAPELPKGHQYCANGRKCRAPHALIPDAEWFGLSGTTASFGLRGPSGKPFQRCSHCRADASQVTRKLIERERRADSPDMRALRVVERWSGLPYETWATPAGREWQRIRSVNLQELWSERMRRTAKRRGAFVGPGEGTRTRVQESRAARVEEVGGDE